MRHALRLNLPQLPAQALLDARLSAGEDVTRLVPLAEALHARTAAVDEVAAAHRAQAEPTPATHLTAGEKCKWRNTL